VNAPDGKGAGPGDERAAGIQIGSDNVQFNYFYGNLPSVVASAKPSTSTSGSSGPTYPGHAFISYVREDSREVDSLQHMLEAAGIQVWRDTASLWPGEDWQVKIRDAITRDALVFIACFSIQGVARQKSYQNEELLLAIDQLRLRRPDVPWLIPVRFDDCAVPDLPLGAGRTLGSIHRADLFGPNSDAAADRLVEAVRRLLGQQKGEASPQPITAAPHIPERVDLSRALAAQCPNCGSFDLDGTEYTLEWKLRCLECAHTWTWRKDAPWPPVRVRPEVRCKE
jgi:TIR domain